VEGHVATTIAFEDFYTALGQQFWGGQNVFLFGIAAESDDWGVFEQQQNVTDAAFFAQFDQALLQAQACGVVDGAELEDRDHKLLGYGLTRITKTKSYLFNPCESVARLQALIAIPYTLFEASSMASASVGWA
jgi:hypothetical protein